VKISRKVGSDKNAQLLLSVCADLWPEYDWDALLQGLGFRFLFESVKAHQSDSQRHYYWMCLKLWGDSIGFSARESEEILHRAVLCEAFGVKETRMVRGSTIEIPNQRSSRLSREDYSLLIETMIRMAAENGFVVPSAERVA